MTSITTKLESLQPAAETAVHLFDHWFDPIEAGLRDRVREFIHAMIEGELDMALSRPRYARHAKPLANAENLPIAALVHADRNQQRDVAHLAGPTALEHDAVEINIGVLALDRTIAPGLDRPVDLLV